MIWHTTYIKSLIYPLLQQDKLSVGTFRSTTSFVDIKQIHLFENVQNCYQPVRVKMTQMDNLWVCRCINRFQNQRRYSQVSGWSCESVVSSSLVTFNVPIDVLSTYQRGHGLGRRRRKKMIDFACVREGKELADIQWGLWNANAEQISPAM